MPLPKHPEHMHHDLRRRTIFKSITMRITIILLDLVVIFLITRKVDTTIEIMILSNLVSTVAYYLHERVWTNVRWGQHQHE